MDPAINQITSFWFDRHPKDWFMTPEGLDGECRDKFGPYVRKARANELDDWTSSINGSLALLILLDQFPRNIYRNSADAYSSDPKAFDIATKSIAMGRDKEVPIYQALTYYLPLMHNENLVSQIAAVALYENQHSKCPENSEEQEFLKTGILAAKGHLDIVKKFGRFPGRNEFLGRTNTPEEEAFLKENPRGLALAKHDQSEEQK